MSAEIALKIIEFNNAGVDAMVATEPGIAWHFFKGAAELKVLSQQNQMMPFRILAESNSFVSIAESLASQNSQLQPASSQRIACNSHLSHHRTCSGGIPVQGAFAGNTSSANQNVETLNRDGSMGSPTTSPEDDTLKLSSECNRPLHHFRAGIISKSVKLVPNSATTIESMSGAILIYNLAVVEHVFNAQNGEPVLLYHLAASLLNADQLEDRKLYGVILNNTGALYWENNLIDEAQSTMRQLQKQLEQENIVPDDLASSLIMRRNIQNILTPPRTMISPAA